MNKKGQNDSRRKPTGGAGLPATGTASATAQGQSVSAYCLTRFIVYEGDCGLNPHQRHVGTTDATKSNLTS